MGPKRLTAVAASSGPITVPSVPPAAMKPNSRRPWALLKQSSSTLQKMLTMNRLNTLTHTKKLRASQTLSRRSASSALNPSSVSAKKR